MLREAPPLPDWLTEGCRFRLIEMPDDPCPVPPGTTGTIDKIVKTDWAREPGYQFWVDWDVDANGEKRTLMLCWPHDEIEPL